MRDARWVTEARRGECGHISNSASHSVTLLSNQGCRPGMGSQRCLMLTVSPQSPESSIFCVLSGFKIHFCFALYLGSSPGASPAVFLPRAICKLPTAMEHPPAAPRGEAEQAGGSGALCALRRLHGVKHHYRKSPASDSSLITCWMRLECFVPLTTVWNALLPAFSSSNALLCKGQRAWDQCCLPLSAHTSCWSCSPQDTCREDAGGHLPPPLHRVTAADQPRHLPGERRS